MNPISLEYRIVKAMMIGDYTATELALALSADIFTVHHILRELGFNKLCEVTGTHRKRWPALRHGLTESGLTWAREMIGGPSCS